MWFAVPRPTNTVSGIKVCHIVQFSKQVLVQSRTQVSISTGPKQQHVDKPEASLQHGPIFVCSYTLIRYQSIYLETCVSMTEAPTPRCSQLAPIVDGNS